MEPGVLLLALHPLASESASGGSHVDSRVLGHVHGHTGESGPESRLVTGQSDAPGSHPGARTLSWESASCPEWLGWGHPWGCRLSASVPTNGGRV